MTDDIKNALARAFDEVFNVRASIRGADLIKQADFSIRDLHDSSIKYVEFCMHVEESLDVEIELSDLLDNPTYLGFSAWLQQQIDNR